MTEIQSLQAEKEVNKDEWGNVYLIGRSDRHEIFTQCNHYAFNMKVPSANIDFDKKINQIQAVSYLRNHRSQLVREAISATSQLKGK